ncbi:putative bifunctional diguanylate cyclase/phosphodiesterase [Gallaecimonas sp. GXIMD1310]|uniref:putative bifunctional diguanylate cyclase/phosphodiesterase n=1 Tax=Gallaecimonas sp. GXIMD1310 TaxID=3131926 RepID=UPI00325234C2
MKRAVAFSLRWQLLLPAFALLAMVFVGYLHSNNWLAGQMNQMLRQQSQHYAQSLFSNQLRALHADGPWHLHCSQTDCELLSGKAQQSLSALSRAMDLDLVVTANNAQQPLLYSTTPEPPQLSQACLDSGSCDNSPYWYENLWHDSQYRLGVLIRDSNLLSVRSAAQTQALIFGLLGLGLFSLLFYWLLRQPLNRLSAISDSLPLLANGAYEQFRVRLRAIGHRKRLLDEPSVLGRRLEKMSLQLESMEEQLQRRASELEWLASHDVLTGLLNRRHFEVKLQDLLRYRQRASLMFMDLDNFKLVNDIAGHKVGDRLLTRVARVLSKVMPENATVARFGGDEFAVLVPGLTEAAEESLLLGLYDALRDVRVSGGGQLHSPSVSIGVAHLPDDGDDIDDILARADIAMYSAKEQGKNRWVRVVHSENEAMLGQHLYWIEKSKHGINSNNLSLYFQPIVDTETREVAHYETLLRARDRSGELVSPVEFIRAAEQTGRTTELDLWVFDELLRLLDRLDLEHQVRLAVNLSPKTFGENTAIAMIAKRLQQRPDLARLLIIEITETAALTNLDKARQFMEQLKRLGCHFALDDFGVGYSSFHTLKSLPVDYIKIDGSFIRGLANQGADSIFVSALVDIADQFGYRTVAEFVEDEEVAELLSILQVSYMQGYLFGQPQPAECLWPSLAVA